jgi:hypothetical protein
VKRISPLLLAVILGLLAIFLTIKVMNRNGNSADRSSDRSSVSVREKSNHASLNGDINGAASTKSDRADAAYKKSLQEMEREFDEILPAQFPDQHSTLCDTYLKSGENLIIGGFKHADGNFEFSSLIVEEIEVDGSNQHFVRMKTFIMSRERVTELGLDSLVSTAKKRIQQSIVFPSNDQSWMSSAVDVMTAPSITMKPGQLGVISVGTDKKGLALSVLTDSGSEGNSIRIRTRIESSVETQNP